jgi:hypothetical protein
MSSKTTIIKLQQNESSSNIEDNGSYEIQLEKPLVVSDGTNIMLKSCFIDTTASSSDSISIDEDLVAQITFGKYIYNYDIDQNLKTYSDANAKPDDSIYFLCDSATHGASVNKLKSIMIFPSDTKQRHWGCDKIKSDTTLRFQYTSSTGKAYPYNISVAQQRTHGQYGVRHILYVGPDEYYPDPEIAELGSLPAFEGDSFIYVGGQEVLHKNNISSKMTIIKTNITAGSTVGTTMRPETVTFGIKKGSYTPMELSTSITADLVNINFFGGDIGNDDSQNIYPVNSPLLTTIQQAKHRQVTTEGQPAVNFCKFDGSRMLQYQATTTGTSDRFIGTNQISLQYDENLKKMMFSIAHFPIYVGDGTSASTGCIFGENGLANKYGGVFFMDMTARIDATGRQVNFWDDMLGFNVGDMCVSSGEGQVLPMVTGAGQPNPTTINYLSSKLNKPVYDGEQMTGALKSIDLPIQKTINFNKVSGSIVDTTTNFTTPIYSNLVFNDPSAKSGYFLLEIDGFNNQQDFRGSNISARNGNANKIQGIITRYYTTESFTMDEGQGGIGFEYTGADTVISSLKVRILDHNGNIPRLGELGDRNTVFLEVTKPREKQIPNVDDLDYSNK